MTVVEMKAYLAEHGIAPESYYSHGGFGAQPDVQGIEFIDGAWHTYGTERGAKLGYKKWDSEAEAVLFLMAQVEREARSLGVWKD